MHIASVMRKFLFTLFAVLPALAIPAWADSSVLSAPEAHQARLSGEIALIDVRTLEEWRETGLAEGAEGVSLQDPDLIDLILQRLDGDKSRPVALICRTGRRSEIVAKRLQAAGFTAVYNVREGMFGRRGAGPGWLARGLPVAAYRSDQSSDPDSRISGKVSS